MTPGTDDKAVDAATLAAKRLVARLHNLHEGPLALAEIISLGESAVPALEAFLRGPSQSLYHPRALAADALARIGGEQALAALIRALRDSIARDLEPLSREAEGVVISRIAEHLSRHRTPAVTDALLDALQKRPYAACARALGDIGDPRAIPLLVECLHEDAARTAAMVALRGFGRAAIPRLRAVLAMPHFVHGIEPPTRIDARTSAAIVLGELGDSPSLMRTLDDAQRSVRIAAAIGLVGISTVPARVIQILIEALDDHDWTRAQAIMQALLPLGASIAGSLEKILADDDSDEAGQRRHKRAAVLAGRLGLAAAAPKLAALASADDPQLRLAAVDALAQIAAADDSLLARFLCDPNIAIAAHAFAAMNCRRALTPRDVSRWLQRASDWKSPWKRWWRIWRLLAAARYARATRNDTKAMP